MSHEGIDARDGGREMEECASGHDLASCCSDECVWMHRIERCVPRDRVCVFGGVSVIYGPCSEEDCVDIAGYFGGPFADCDGSSHDVRFVAGVCE